MLVRIVLQHYRLLYESPNRLRRESGASETLNDVEAANGLAADEVRYSLQYLDGGTAMPVTVKSISLWRKEAENKTGSLPRRLSRLQRPGRTLAF